MASMAYIFLSKRIHHVVLLLSIVVVLFSIWMFPKLYRVDPDPVRAATATFVVDTTADGTASAADCENGTPSGNDCSLRDAITAANATTTPTALVINFTIPTDDANYYCYNSSNAEVNITTSGSGSCSGSTRWWKIAPTSTLPTITNGLGVTIDGYTQTGASQNTLTTSTDAVLKIEIDGTSAGASSPGLVIAAAGVTVKGLAVNRFLYHGIEVSASSTVLTGNYVGTDITGLIDRGNTAEGIIVNGGTGHTIGGSAASARNVVSGQDTSGDNYGHGIGIYSAGTDSVTVQNNYIGVGANGSTKIGNAYHGINVNNGPASVSIVGNVVASSTYNGISFLGTEGAAAGTNTGHTVTGNYVGVTADGSTLAGNDDYGISLSYTSNSTIGGTSASLRNVVSGNEVGVGILLSSNSNTVIGNYIGTDLNGTTDKGNSSYGVTISSSTSNIIGGDTSSERNIISGNDGGGVQITGSGSTSNTVSGNYIGLKVAGTASLANTGSGIVVTTSASSNTIGGTDSGTGNVISGNTASGIDISSSTTTVQGNYIGTNAAGTSAIRNSLHGIKISGSNNTIGGTSSAARNVISGHSLSGSFGVLITSNNATGNTVLGNYIGTNAAGTAVLANETGVQVESSASSNTIGGTVSGAGNVISGNSGKGLVLSSVESTTVTGNYIGTDTAGTADLPNGNAGVYLSGASSSTIGGSSSGANIIRGNSAQGIMCIGSSSSNTFSYNTIYNNLSDQIYLDTNCSSVTVTRNTVGNSGTPTNLGTYTPTYTIFTADGNTYDGCGGSGSCMYFYSTSLGTGSGSLITITSSTVAANFTTAVKGNPNFHLWLGTLSDLPGTYLGIFVRSDQFSTAAAVASDLETRLDAGTATTNYFESNVLTASNGDYTFKGLANFTNSGITISSSNGSTSPLAISRTTSTYYGYYVLASSPTISYEACLNIGNCFAFVPSSSGSYTVTSSTLSTVANTTFRTGGSATVNLLIQDTPAATSTFSRAASGTITQKFNTRAKVLASNGQGVGDATVVWTGSQTGQLASLTTDLTSYTATVNLTTFTSGASGAVDDTVINVAVTKSGQIPTSATYLLDTADEIVTVTFTAPQAAAAPAPAAPTAPTTATPQGSDGAAEVSVPAPESNLTAKEPAKPVETAAEIAPEAQAVRQTAEAVIRYQDDPTVYVVRDGKKLPVINDAALADLGFSFSDVKVVSKDVQYPKGETLYTPLPKTSSLDRPTLVKYPNDPKVFFLDQGKLRHIQDEKTFLDNGFQWSDVKIISPKVAPPKAPPITARVEKAFVAPLSGTLSLGQSGDQVAALQQILRRAGYLAESTGKFDSATQSAVRRFQKDNGLPQVGIVGPATRAKLNVFVGK